MQVPQSFAKTVLNGINICCNIETTGVFFCAISLVAAWCLQTVLSPVVPLLSISLFPLILDHGMPSPRL
ncbi:hypothetical protein HOLleu_26094 [Holothuria leucospilota]|uniref:Uncharacterized protein n=1 Tax=Holothuria leucospilota TaxID=206669 RepID=A0A9Q1BTS9_HOLLE|nr:hypothetical protein HOLleu_26094 [Holothuria leucospilota]